ncbi:MotA/TolQ/ExbB proton channel family protein [Vannielia litorea]|uniref:MotA/TolQ/ExbB proton channel family protein n=1 Tax=Vannielia litorea TaxID=1217970 RepID=UPI0021BD030F|nr:MotA/TolQ/ExbB proton channel family protein [Vannielia litorea]
MILGGQAMRRTLLSVALAALSTGAGIEALQAQDTAPDVAQDAPAAPAAPEAADSAPAVSGGADTAPSAASETPPAIGGSDSGASGAEAGEAAEQADAAAPAGEVTPAAAAPAEPAEPQLSALERLTDFLIQGGPAIWAISALSVLTLALILWKIWRFSAAGAWSRKHSFRAVRMWTDGQRDDALSSLARRRGVRSRMTRAAMLARRELDEESAREEVSRVAKRELSRLSGGLRALELIATIAPLLGLLGTVLGMIDAFQTLQESGNRADPAMLAGGIWEALLTTAAGMAVAIPASIALTWFESIRDGVREDMEDIAARLFVADAPPQTQLARAAE